MFDRKREILGMAVTSGLEEDSFEVFTGLLQDYCGCYDFGFLGSQPVATLRTGDRECIRLRSVGLDRAFMRRFVAWPDGFAAWAEGKGPRALEWLFRGLAGQGFPHGQRGPALEWAWRIGLLPAARELVAADQSCGSGEAHALFAAWMERCTLLEKRQRSAQAAALQRASRRRREADGRATLRMCRNGR